ncbi:MAG: hypothetical protein AAGC68_16485, partial [Verrucomicrobiota bacterium]
MSPDLVGKEVVDCFLAPSWAIAIDSGGSLYVRGKDFDGIKQPGNGEWAEKPAMPEGVRAVSLSACTPGLSVMGSDGILRSWSSNRGALEVPDNLVAGGVTQFAHGPHFIVRLSNNAEPLMKWHYRNGSGEGKVENAEIEAVDVFTTCEGIVLRSAAGEIEPVGSLEQKKLELSSVLPLVNASSREAISVFKKNRPGSDGDQRILWFDGEVSRVAPPVAMEVTAAPTESPAMAEGDGSKRPTDEDISLVAMPDDPAIRTRVAAYQKARQGQLSTIASAYAEALSAAEKQAQTNGELDSLLPIQDGLKKAKTLLLHLELLGGSSGIAPVILPPALAEPIDPSVQAVREKFEISFVAAEQKLAEALDQSLHYVQQEQVKNREIAEARTTQDLRNELTARFAAAFPDGEEQTIAAAPASPQSMPPTAPQTTAPATPPAPSPAGQPVSKPTTKPGRLQVWTSGREDDAMRITRARGFDDLIQVQIYKDGWIVLRENG